MGINMQSEGGKTQHIATGLHGKTSTHRTRTQTLCNENKHERGSSICWMKKNHQKKKAGKLICSERTLNTAGNNVSEG